MDIKTPFTVLLLLSFSSIFCQNIQKADSICKKYIINGQSITENKVTNSQKSGYWTYYYDDKGDIISNYTDATDITLVYFEAGVPKDICIFCDLKAKPLGYGKYTEDTTWREHGEFIWLDKNGRTISKEKYEYGKLNGKTFDYYKNGNIMIEYNYNIDTLKTMKTFREKGQLFELREFSYQKDTIVVVKQYRNDGSIIIYQRQVNNLDDGDYIIYNNDGSIKMESKNIQGIRISEKKYHKNGNLIKETRCKKDGSDCTFKIYSKNGKLKKETTGNYPGLKLKPVR